MRRFNESNGKKKREERSNKEDYRFYRQRLSSLCRSLSRWTEKTTVNPCWDLLVDFQFCSGTFAIAKRDRVYTVDLDHHFLSLSLIYVAFSLFIECYTLTLPLLFSCLFALSKPLFSPVCACCCLSFASTSTKAQTNIKG